MDQYGYAKNIVPPPNIKILCGCDVLQLECFEQFLEASYLQIKAGAFSKGSQAESD